MQKMLRFDESKLKPGDILLTTSNHPVSRIVRAFTNSKISHVMLYVDNFSVIDSTNEGVHARNTERIYLEKNCLAFVMRVKNGVTVDQLERVEYYLRPKIGTSYSLAEAIITIFGGWKSLTRKQFCSRLIAQAFHNAGIRLVSDPNYCSPEDIKNSSLLKEVSDALVEVEHQETKKDVDVPQIMRDSTNYILLRARKRNRKIQSLNDLYFYLMQNPHEDEFMDNLFVNSGYLDVWKIEKKYKYWQYDLEAFSCFQMGNSEKRNYCLQVRLDTPKILERHLEQSAKFKAIYGKYPLKTFQHQIELYEALVSLCILRLQIIEEWLSNNV